VDITARVLGPLEVVVDGIDVTPRAPKEQALLATLVLNAGQVVTADRLCEELWPGLDGGRARHALHVRVGCVRKLLAAAKATSILQLVPAGYRLDLDTASVDEHRFVALVERARVDLEGNQPTVALASLEAALALWRGDPLAGASAGMTLELEANRLRALHLDAIEDRFDALLASGRHKDAVSELVALAAAHPLRERLWRQSVLALYRCGRQAEALRALATVRRALREELGVEPDSALRSLEAAVLHQRPELDWSPDSMDQMPPVLPRRAGEIGLVPLPDRLAVRPPVGVVGRGAELAMVRDHFERVTADAGREVLLVSGEAGVGKTTLIGEAARVAFERGACVLFGHCEEDLASPYQLFGEALGHLVEHAGDEELVGLVGGHAAELASLMPDLTRRLPGLGPSTATDADTGRFQLFAAVVDLLAALSVQRPMVLVLEDMQWADRASLQLLRHVVGSERRMRLFVVATCRDSELSRAHPMVDTLAELHRLGRVTRFELGGLGEAGVAAYIKAAHGQTLDGVGPAFASELHRETGGNPFFVGEVLRHLAATGALVRDTDGRWTSAVAVEEMSLPPSVHAVIDGRIGRLGGDAERVLSLAAVIGRDFDLDLLTTADGTSVDEVLAVLDAAAASALVRELSDTPGHYCFVHALIQHTVYAQLGRTRRARAHRQVAEALEVLCGDRPGPRVGELARHWSAAIRPDAAAKALHYTRGAADSALAALAPGDALGYYTQALALSARQADADPLLDLDLTIGLGVAQRQTGHAGFRDTLLGAARRAAELGDPERLAAAALANDRGMFSVSGDVDEERVEVLELAIAGVPRDHRSRPLLLATLCSELTFAGDLRRRQVLAQEAVALARAFGDDETMVRVLTNVAYPLAVPPLLAQALRRSAEALERAERLGDPVLLWRAADQRSVLAISAGDVAEMERCVAITWSLADQLDQPFLRWQGTLMRAHCALLAGDTREAEARAIEALDIGTRSGQPDADLIFAGQIAAVDVQRGVFPDDMVAKLEQARVRLPGFRVTLAALLAWEHARTGRRALAQELLDEFAASGFEPMPESNGWLRTMIHFSDVAISCDDHQAAAALYERLVPYPDHVAGTGGAPYPSVHHYLGKLATLLRHYERADAHFTSAVEFNTRAGAAYFAAETDLAWGTMFLQRGDAGDTERARTRLDSARSVAADRGYADVERRATEVLDQLA
jgi:DNA-binding SARP family transcriptional activator